ncbi:hypothetical protein ABPG72_018589 [Tetrahymena utriculariae]
MNDYTISLKEEKNEKVASIKQEKKHILQVQKQIIKDLSLNRTLFGLLKEKEKGSYFDKKVFQKWSDDILLKYVKEYPNTKKGILFLDNFSGHSYIGITDTLSKINYEIVYLPPNSTDKLLPLDLVVNKSYKAKYKAYYAEYMLINEDTEKLKLDHTSFLKFLSQSWKECKTENAWSVYQNKETLKDSRNVEDQVEIQEQNVEEMPEDVIVPSEDQQFIIEEYTILNTVDNEQKESSQIINENEDLQIFYKRKDNVKQENNQNSEQENSEDSDKGEDSNEEEEDSSEGKGDMSYEDEFRDFNDIDDSFN